MENNQPRKVRTTRYLMVGSIIFNLMFGFGYLNLSNNYSMLSTKQYKCSELIKAWDSLLQEHDNDYIQMSSLAVKHVNNQQLNADEPGVYDKLKANQDELAKWHEKLTASYHADCE